MSEHIPILGEVDVYLINEGTHYRLYDVMGAHPRTIGGVDGTTFAVWAPNARRVSVVGDFNGWDGRLHPMYLRRECGVWEMFIPGVGAGAHYKYELEDRNGTLLPLRADPFAFTAERRPANASIVWSGAPYRWNDDEWMRHRAGRHHHDAPIAIYEVHPGSWRRKADDGDRFLSYRELADELIPYASDLGFTHIEFLPVTEHPFDGSWGYQSTGFFAPTSRFGSPDDFRSFVETAHQAGIGVIIDWVPGHFPTDAFGLGTFDGTHLYEHADPRKGFHYEWGTYAFNHGRTEVANFLLASALMWLREFHIDGLRVDAVSSMIYLDYAREHDGWEPNMFGGNESLESTAFLRRFNATVYGEVPGIMTIAEESTAWPGVTVPTEYGGLGFGFKWNMGWMHDTLRFMSRDPLYRGSHMGELSFGLVYAFSENFVLPFSHDEVVHGKGSLIERMPGSTWERFANLRALYAFMYAQPGKKLLFSGAEFGQWDEWDEARSLDWHLTQWASHSGIQRLVGDLNRLYRALPALHARDVDGSGFEWIQYDDSRNAVIAWVRWNHDRSQHVVAICNFSGVQHDGYRLGVPRTGAYHEVLNTDAEWYDGGNAGNFGAVHAEAIPAHGREASITVTLPRLGCMYFTA